jgi:hypothetical protein
VHECVQPLCPDGQIVGEAGDRRQVAEIADLGDHLGPGC